MKLESTSPLAVQVEHVRRGKGHLTIYRTTSNGVVISELFSLKSLADVRGVEPHIMNGLYQRRNLEALMVPIVNAGTRSLRGFYLSDLETVETLLDTPGSRPVVRRVNPVNSATPELAPQSFESGRYFTISHLADQIGRSVTATRARLAKANLIPLMEDIYEAERPGRPRRGWHERYATQITNALLFGTPVEVERPQSLLGRTATPTAPVTPSPLAAERTAPHNHLAPVVPIQPAVNRVNPSNDPLQAEIDEMAAELEAFAAEPPPANYNPVKPERPRYRRIINRVRVPVAWERDPSLMPESEHDQAIMRRWDWLALPDEGAWQEAPENPHEPMFMGKLRAAYEKHVVPRAAKRQVEYRRTLAALQKDHAAAFRSRSLELVNEIDEKIRSLKAPDPADVEAFMADATRLLPLMKRTYDAIWGDNPRIFDEELMPIGNPEDFVDVALPPDEVVRAALDADSTPEDIEDVREGMRMREVNGERAYTDAEIEQAIASFRQTAAAPASPTDELESLAN